MSEQRYAATNIGDNSGSLKDTSISPSLPSDVCGVIAEFLAGNHAFGTLASLNVTNRDTHDTTLPVLYETVLWDHIEADMNLTGYFLGGDEARPKGFRFTDL